MGLAQPLAVGSLCGKMSNLTFSQAIDVPPVWLAGALALTWLHGAWAPLGATGAGWRLLGLGLIAAGLGLIVWAAWTMHRLRTTVVPHQDPDALVTSGPFAFSRNPIYLGDALVLAGCAIRWQAWVALLLVPLFMALIARRFIAGEEARLVRHFGAAFESYASSVRRWI
jgi:protein-S-isoprenylcysteine O-methyltransferase Ste14